MTIDQDKIAEDARLICFTAYTVLLELERTLAKTADKKNKKPGITIYRAKFLKLRNSRSVHECIDGIDVNVETLCYLRWRKSGIEQQFY